MYFRYFLIWWLLTNQENCISGIFWSDERNPVSQDGLGRSRGREKGEKRPEENQVCHPVNKFKTKQQKSYFIFTSTDLLFCHYWLIVFWYRNKKKDICFCVTAVYPNNLKILLCGHRFHLILSLLLLLLVRVCLIETSELNVDKKRRVNLKGKVLQWKSNL